MFRFRGSPSSPRYLFLTHSRHGAEDMGGCLARSLLAGDEPPAPRCRMKKDRRAAFDLNQGNEAESGFFIFGQSTGV
jgi:hypothetical protein